MAQPYDPFMGGGAKSVTFNNLGDSVCGIVLGPPEERIQTDQVTKEVKLFKDGTPRKQYVVQLQTELRDPSDPTDTGQRQLFLKWHSLDAVRAAIRAVGARGLAYGGVLTVTFVDVDRTWSKAGQPPKLYSASYIPPTDEFMGAPLHPEVSYHPPAQPAYPQQGSVRQPQPAPAPQYSSPLTYAQPAQQQAAPPPPPPPPPPSAPPAVATPAQQSAVIERLRAQLAARPTSGVPAQTGPQGQPQDEEPPF